MTATCTLIEGQDYTAVPTERPWIPGRVHRTAPGGRRPARWVAHRRDCHASWSGRQPAGDRQALAALAQDAMACPACRPNQELLPQR
ncbi:DUF6233 domain-containing protein [Streptomyces mirabilis]|uniref:DUF6233 domain-containing protein n=1 Tax=Streptomyces mirabilis TaxID=68239 RepID=UPI0036DF2FE1